MERCEDIAPDHAVSSCITDESHDVVSRENLTNVFGSHLTLFTTNVQALFGESSKPQNVSTTFLEVQNVIFQTMLDSALQSQAQEMNEKHKREVETIRSVYPSRLPCVEFIRGCSQIGL